MRVELGRDYTYYSMAKSAFVMRLVNLRSVTYYTKILKANAYFTALNLFISIKRLKES